MVTFVSGQMQKFVSNIEFSLNFEDRKNSVKVKAGESVFYDGTIAKFTKMTGEEVMGKTPSLKAAINNKWLTLHIEGEASPTLYAPATLRVNTPKDLDPVQYQDGKYHPLTGGSFDDYLNKDGLNGEKQHNIIREEDLIVRRSKVAQTEPQQQPPREKLQVVGDQVNVKEVPRGPTSVTVNSSTSIGTERKRQASKVIRDTDYNSDGIRQIKKIDNGKQEKQEKKGFTVDDSIPRVPEDATMSEVKRSTQVLPQEEQGAQVVKRVGERKKMAVVQQDSAADKVVKKIGQPVEVSEEGITFTKGTTPAESSTESEGIRFSQGTPKATEGPVQVRSASSSDLVDLTGVKTQEEADALQNKIKKAGENFIDKLPKDWSEMHWVKKEKFIMQQTDKEFIKFILMVDTIKAVQNACRKRLLEIEKAAKS